MTIRPTRYLARWLLPVSSPPVRDAAVLVDADGRIASAGPTAGVPSPDDARTIDLGDAALLPGLVNTHAHLELSFARGLIEDRPFPDWIASLLQAKRLTALDEPDLLAAARASCAEAIAAGITTLAATEDSDAGFQALLETGLRGIVYREVFGPAPSQADGAVAELRGRVDSMRRRATDLVRAGISPHAPFTVSDALFERTSRYALDEDLPVAVHVAESRDEENYVVQGAGVFGDRLRARGIAVAPRSPSPVALLERTGILRTRPLLIHCVRANPADIDRMRAAGVSVAHCPVANARLGHGIAPVTAMLEAGLTVALGSDSVASNNRMDILEEARFAQMLQRVIHGDATLLPAEQLLRMATLDGARALGLDGRVGSIVPGRDADLCAVRLDGFHVKPVNDPVAALFHSARASDVVLTVVRGRILYSDGVVHSLDAPAALKTVDALAARARAALAGSGDTPA